MRVAPEVRLGAESRELCAKLDRKAFKTSALACRMCGLKTGGSAGALKPSSAVEHWVGKVDRESGATYPLVGHLEDCAAVAGVLAPGHPVTAALVAAWGVPAEDAQDLLVFLAAIHDLGKFSDKNGFQQQCQAWLQGRRARGSRHHTELGQLLVSEGQGQLANRLGVEDPFYALRFLVASLAHHGLAVPIERGFVDRHFSGAAQGAAWAWFERCLERYPGARRLLAAIADDEIEPAEMSWGIAGFVVLSDWLSSNRDFFPFQSIRDPKQAEDAAAKAGVRPPQLAEPGASILEFAELRPLQSAVAAVFLGKAPGTFILEAETGSGKTEAAILLARRLLERGASGIYWALPTQATSDAMHERMTTYATRLFPDMPLEDVVLAHGGRPHPESTSPGGTDCASNRAGAWLADGLKRALLSPFAVGTIDQALLAALPVKHQCLRLAGLAGKVLVVDEVHAYDNYELRLLERLLEIHHLQGGHAILLSATLPSGLRERLLGGPIEGAAYPLISWRHESRGALPVADELSKPKRMHMVHGEDQVAALIEQAAPGQCVAWIRNSVAETAAAADLLRERGLDPILFHSRFTRHDRRQIEERVARAGGAERPPMIVVATQVLEQSLDVDFDVIVTDLCPMDLIVQRMGRLHRHRRNAAGRKHGGPDERGEAILYVHVPEGPPRQALFSGWSPATAYIYNDHGLLWRTLEAIRARPAVESLDDIRRLVEDVYSSTDAPQCFETSSAKARAEAEARGQIGGTNAIDWQDGYWSLIQAAAPEDAVTRLGSPSSTVVLTRDGHPIHGSWQDSSLRVPQSQLKKLSGQRVPDDGSPLARQVQHGYVTAFDADEAGYDTDRGLIP